MNAFPHCLRHYLRRFRLETIFFWIVSGALTGSLWFEKSEEVTSRLGFAEWLCFAVVVFRVIAAESVFKTTAGWGLRPVSGSDLAGARWAMAAVLIVPPLIFRALVWQITTHPGTGNWRNAFWNDLLPIALAIVATALVVHCVRLLQARESPGLWLLVICPALIGLEIVLISRMPDRGHFRFSTTNTRPLSQGVVAAMPAGGQPIHVPLPEDGYHPALIGRFPLEAGIHRKADMTIAVKRVRGKGEAVSVGLVLSSAKVLPKNDDFSFVVRYADGSFTGPGVLKGTSERIQVPFYERYRFSLDLLFTSPLSLPWSEVSQDAVLKGAELFVFGKTDLPFTPAFKKLSAEFAGAGIASLELLHARPDARDWQWKPQYLAGNPIPLLLKWPTWSEAAWSNFVEPELRKALVEDFKTDLADRLETEQRLAPLMVERNLAELAIPRLSQRMADGRPVDAANLALLIDAEHPKEKEDLAQALLRIEHWAELKPVTDAAWHAEMDRLAAENWANTGGPAGDLPATPELAMFAARRGDREALRFLARAGDSARLKPLLEAPVPDPAGWLGRHAEALRFDPASGKYSTGPKP